MPHTCKIYEIEGTACQEQQSLEIYIFKIKQLDKDTRFEL